MLRLEITGETPEDLVKNIGDVAGRLAHVAVTKAAEAVVEELKEKPAPKKRTRKSKGSKKDAAPSETSTSAAAPADPAPEAAPTNGEISEDEVRNALMALQDKRGDAVAREALASVGCSCWSDAVTKGKLRDLHDAALARMPEGGATPPDPMA